MTGIEVAVGFLIAWAARRAKHFGDGLGKETDQALDKALNALHQLVSSKLGEDAALTKLNDEAAEAGDASPRTRKRLELALEEALDEPAFAESFELKVVEVQRVYQQTMGPKSPQAVGSVHHAETGVVVGTVHADQHSVAVGTVFGPMTLHQNGKTTPACHCSRDAIGVCSDCQRPLCQVHNEATRKRQIAVPSKVVELTILELWAAAASEVLCGDCLTAAEEDLLSQIPIVSLPDDPNPVVRLIKLADREYWSTRQWIAAWASAVHRAAEELGGTVAVFEAAAAAVLMREETQYFPAARRGEGLDGAVAGEEVTTYQRFRDGVPTGRLAVVDKNLNWYYVNEAYKPGRYGMTRIPDVKLQGISVMMELAVPAFSDYVHFPVEHDLMPDPWGDGELSSRADHDALETILARHRWTGRRKNTRPAR
jgi:hypothetical protein